MDQNSITKHWITAGMEFPRSGKITPTSRDPNLSQLERKNFLRFLRKTDSVLEIGCGDGQNTIEYCQKAKEIFGVDVSPPLVKIAERRKSRTKIENLYLTIGSIIEIGKIFPNKKFDWIISQRCLINIADWEDQKNVLIQLHNLLKPKGKLLLSEGFDDGFKPLNRIRKELNLKPLKIVKYNNNFTRRKFEKFIQNYFKIVEIRDYGLYLLLSRTITPLLSWPKPPKHDSKINKAFMQLSETLNLETFEEFSYNLFYVLRKK